MQYTTSYMVRKSKIRLTREQLGLSSSQLAHRLGVAQSSVVRLEQSEERGAVTLAALERAAAALDCQLKYRLKPLAKQSKPESYAGLRRSARLEGRKGALSREMSADVLRAANALSPEQRLAQAFELSDFARELQQ